MEPEDFENYIGRVFEENRIPELVYHNFDHTRTVVSRVREISRQYNLTKTELLIVECAAWFHDLGYLRNNDPHGHESIGAEIASDFLREKRGVVEIIEAVRGCIMATTLPQKPATHLEKIVCDADLYHLGTPDLFAQDSLMRKEVELRRKIRIEEHKWIAGTIAFLNGHHYHTDYCQNFLDEGKRLNLRTLNAKLQ